ncbi:hypothetical protein FA95DRAFT_1566677, partial [Auriscalpium vulgare]
MVPARVRPTPTYVYLSFHCAQGIHLSMSSTRRPNAPRCLALTLAFFLSSYALRRSTQQ